MEKGVKETLILKMQEEIVNLKRLEGCIRGTRMELEEQVRRYTGQKRIDEVLNK